MVAGAAAVDTEGDVAADADADAGPETDGDVDTDGDWVADRPLPRVLTGTTAAFVALTVAFSLVAGPLYGLADRAAADLLDRTPYVSAVLGR